jgi:flagellar assembly protein FliH
LFNNKIIKQSDADLYSMPSLEDEGTGQSRGRLVKKTEAIQRQAYEEGFASGEAAGYAAGEQKALVLIERLEMIIKEITAFKNSLAKDVESQIVDLSVAIARKIIIEEISTKPDIITTMVQEALIRLERTGKIKYMRTSLSMLIPISPLQVPLS